MNSPEDSLLEMDIQQGQTQLGPNTGQMTMVQFLDKRKKRYFMNQLMLTKS